MGLEIKCGIVLNRSTPRNTCNNNTHEALALARMSTDRANRRHKKVAPNPTLCDGSNFPVGRCCAGVPLKLVVASPPSGSMRVDRAGQARGQRRHRQPRDPHRTCSDLVRRQTTRAVPDTLEFAFPGQTVSPVKDGCSAWYMCTRVETHSLISGHLSSNTTSNHHTLSHSPHSCAGISKHNVLPSPHILSLSHSRSCLPACVCHTLASNAA